MKRDVVMRLFTTVFSFWAVFSMCDNNSVGEKSTKAPGGGGEERSFFVRAVVPSLRVFGVRVARSLRLEFSSSFRGRRRAV